MKFNRIHCSIRVSVVLALFFVLLSVGFMPAIAQTGTDWQKANGGWIVIKNSHQHGTGGPFQPCPGQTGCRGLSLHVEHGVCINAVTFANPTTGASWTPPTHNIILAQDCGDNDWMHVSCPVVTEYWVPAGTYTLTEFTYVSEVNPGDPNYSPCHNAWSKPSKVVAINPGDTVDFGESIFMSGLCTVGGYPCSAISTGGSFEITNVEWPATVIINGPRGDLTVYWSGDPVFPVRVVARPKTCEGSCYCTTPTMTFETKQNPLVFPEAYFCTGPCGHLDYEVVIIDARDVESAPYPTPHDCISP